MSALLDTHVLLWFQRLDKRLDPELRERVERSDEDFYVSHVSFWEIAIKTSIGKLNLDRDIASTYRLIHEAGFKTLAFHEAHFIELAQVPLHHRAPLRPDAYCPSES